MIQTHGVLILSREPTEAKGEDQSKGLGIGKHKLRIITTLEVAGELSRWIRQANRAAGMKSGDSVDTCLFRLFRLSEVFHAEWEIGTAEGTICD